MSKGKEIIDLDTSSEEIDYDSPDYRGPPKSLLKCYGYLSDEYKDKGGNESDAKYSFSDISKAKACMLAKAQASDASSKAKQDLWSEDATNYGLCRRGRLAGEVDFTFFMYFEIIVLSSDSSDDDRKGPSKANVPIFEGPSVQGLLDFYGYNDIEEYLSWNYFPSTDKENTDKDIIDKDTTDEDCIHECNYAMSKGKYVPVSHKPNPKVKSLEAVRGCVLGLANVTIWEEIVNHACFCICKQAFASKHLQASIYKQAFAACICRLHLQQAFASKHLQPAYATCICSKHLQPAFAGSIYKQAFASKHLKASICSLHIQLTFASKHLQARICSLHMQLAFASKHFQASIFKQAFASKHLQASICKQAFAASMCSLHLQASISSLPVLKVQKNNLEALKVLKNSLEVLNVLQSNLESMELHENSSIDEVGSLSIKKIHIQNVSEAVK
ncbi:hypothetical protein Tco_1264052 [Tanacetum coccineum]